MNRSNLVLVLFLLMVGFRPLTFAAGGQLNLTADPGFVTINGMRTAVVSVDEKVTFSIDPTVELDGADWEFEGGDPAGSGFRTGSEDVYYKDDLVGAIHNVYFGGSRTDGEEQCITNTKVTCKVAVGVIQKKQGQPPNVEYKRVGPTNNNVFVGEKITLKMDFPATVQEYKWILPGTAFKKWTPTGSSWGSAELQELAADDLNDQMVTFYWADGAEDSEVKCEIKVAGQWFVMKAKMNSIKPVATVATTAGAVQLTDAVTDMFGNDYGPGLMFDGSGPTAPYGMKFVPSSATNFGSETQIRAHWQWVQVGHLVRLGKTAGNVWWKSETTGIDTVYSYPFGGSGPPNTNDSPGQSFSSWVEVSIADTFSMYLMYNPGTEDSMWVPIARVDWKWNGGAYLDPADSEWKIISGSTAGTSDNGTNKPTIDYNPDHPEWSSNLQPPSWIQQ